MFRHHPRHPWHLPTRWWWWWPRLQHLHSLLEGGGTTPRPPAQTRRGNVGTRHGSSELDPQSAHGDDTAQPREELSNGGLFMGERAIAAGAPNTIPDPTTITNR